jgi:threonine dehydratase
VIDLGAIREAAARIRGRLVRTPVVPCPELGDLLGIALTLKCESLQTTGSFKPRGALNKVLSLSPQERARGLITVSAGNHAQAVAWAARATGAACTVVMPVNAPPPKLRAVRGYGARAVLHDDRATLFDRMAEEQKTLGATFVHPFDDPVVLAGAGTVGLEILEDVPDAEAVIVPVGGGGLMGGVVSAVKAVNPRVRTVAVELAAGPGLGPALAAGKPVPVPRPDPTLADGMTPPFVGRLPLQIAREAVDTLVTVDEAAIADAVRRLLTRARLVVEGSGAAATAALLSRAVTFPPGTRVVSIVSGGNLDLDVLPRILGGGAG